MTRSLVRNLALVALAASCSGCIAGRLVGGMLQNEEYQKKVEVLAEYDGLQDRSVAVLVQADLATLYEHPGLIQAISNNVAGRIQEHVAGARVVDPRLVVDWQMRTTQWEALPYGELATRLGVERVVHIDIYEYRLHPPGNRWLWEGVCLATISIIEAESADPDLFVETFTVQTTFPNVPGLSRDEATPGQIETGLIADFVKKTAWLFHTHIEPKYPDKYRPHLDPDPI